MKDIGKYRLVAEIGRGGMADVFLALAPGPNGFNKPVVVKEMRGGGSEDRALAMFLDEARIAARLNHPNIAQIHEVGYHGAGVPFLALEFVEGQSLHAVLRRGRHEVPRPVLLRVAADVLAALDYAHTLCDFDGTPLGIVHRDVSPHNVIVSYDGFGKLVDFGIAKASVRDAATQTGVLKGKVAYMAPEQAASRPVDARSDLFSVGVMLYQAVTGRRFWGNEHDLPILVRLANGRLPDLSEGLAEVPEALAAIVRRAVAAEPADRYASAAEFQADLERYGAAGPGMASRREVGGYVAKLFAAERASLRDLLDKRARAERARDEAEDELPRLQSLGGGTSSGVATSSLPKASPTETLAPGRAPSGRRAVAYAAAAALACAGAYALGVGGTAGRAVEAAPVAPAPLAPPAPESPAAAAPAAEAPPPPALVRLKVEAKPAQARIFLDDRPLPTNPAAVAVTAETEHRVRAEADGFTPAAQSIAPGADASVTLTLQPSPRARAGAPRAVAAPKPAPAAAHDAAGVSTTKAAADAAGF